MATLQDLLDDLNGRLGDADNDAGAGEATKIRWINRGISAMWPRIYRTAQDATLQVATDTYEYAVPAAVGDEGEIYRVELEDPNAAGTRYIELDNYDIVPMVEDQVIQLPSWVIRDWVGAHIRITAAKPLSELATVGSTFDGRRIHEELPVWYALGLALANPIEDRTDYTRYATIDGRNGVDINELMGTSQFAFAQFELLLDRMQMPWPTSVG